ncbi:arginase family protein [Actinomadura rudentiformis]|uniref:Arginase family protein n=1 Tax=Actinomadura rudentiformis TaxID=359158 RepID=A0A6H9Z7U7_9ACTN|nr:arginase family protein [Actinomadura rudentiformis]KAB2352426.1 arginase family protein [Actinomadura rudentiformis]
MTTVLCVPQWQGSASDRAPYLREGALRTAELVEADETVTVPVPERIGTRSEGVRALDVLVETLRLTEKVLSGIDDTVLTVGGDCAVDLAPIAAARAEHGDDLTLLWIDANPDVFAPEELPSGAFHGMVVRALLGDGPAPLNPAEPLTPAQVVIAGERADEPAEHAYLRAKGIRTYGVDDFERALDGLTGPVYLHVDLDVLDPADFRSVCYSYPDGVSAERLIDLVSQVDGVVGAAITEHAPAEDPSPAETEIIQRLAAAIRL